MKTPHEIGLEAAEKTLDGLQRDNDYVVEGKILEKAINAYLRATGLDQVISLEEEAEPQVGDIVITPKTCGTVIQISKSFVSLETAERINGKRGCRYQSKSSCKIIQRHGKPVVTIPKQKEGQNEE